MKHKNLTAVLATLGLTAAAHSATISWTGSNITSDSDVSTNGTLVFGVRGNTATGATTTVNGVDFLHTTRADLAATTQGQSPGTESMTTTLGNDNASSFQAGGVGGDLAGLINGGYWGTTSGNTATVSFTGLTIGQNYEIQLFTNDARTSRSIVYEMDLSDGNGGTGVTLQLNNSPDNTNTPGSEPGDFAIGTFTADSANQSFELAGMLNGAANAGRTQVNGFQLRDLGPSIPEPSSALLALIGLGFGLRRRR